MRAVGGRMRLRSCLNRCCPAAEAVVVAPCRRVRSPQMECHVCCCTVHSLLLQKMKRYDAAEAQAFYEARGPPK